MKKYYKFKHIDKTVRKKSSSGGAFTAISQLILEKSGVVYGAVLDENLNVVHRRAVTENERNSMRGSKYVSSSISEVYQQLKEDLLDEKTVLFTGTPCEVSAVINFLDIFKISKENLVTVEVICHGIGSPKFFKSYVEYLEMKYMSKAVKCNFRAKNHIGQKQDMEITFANGKKYNASSTKYDWFYSVYLKNLILRPSCYQCPYAKKDRVADISIADYWEKDKVDVDANSLVVVSSEKGGRIFREACVGNYFEEIEVEKVYQPHMYAPCEKPKDREMFWALYIERGYLAVQKWMGNNTFKGKIKDRLARYAYKLHIAGVIKRVLRFFC